MIANNPNRPDPRLLFDPAGLVERKQLCTDVIERSDRADHSLDRLRVTPHLVQVCRHEKREAKNPAFASQYTSSSSLMSP